jgi:glutathione synthase/RimK-type ligase-like ATP-grasp enzyme
MKSIYIAGGKENNKAVKVVTSHLVALGHYVTRDAQDPSGWDATLRWGISYKGKKPALNAHVNEFDKLEALNKFYKAGVPAPTVVSLQEAKNAHCGNGMELPELSAERPWLARKIKHSKGKDIAVCKTYADVQEVLRNQTHEFFSVFIPTDAEYRVWVFKNKVLAVYEKVYKGVGEYQGYMRNRRFGFSFQKKDDERENATLKGPSIAAVKALGMDWGAIDVIKGKDGKYYILEVNSMPVIEDEKRSSGIRLAKQVSLWAEGL